MQRSAIPIASACKNCKTTREREEAKERARLFLERYCKRRIIIYFYLTKYILSLIQVVEKKNVIKVSPLLQIPRQKWKRGKRN